jgi:hypothetical protein
MDQFSGEETPKKNWYRQGRKPPRITGMDLFSGEETSQKNCYRPVLSSENCSIPFCLESFLFPKQAHETT